MIDLYGGQTPNVFKPLIALEELGLEYRRIPVDIMNYEQFAPAFLAISPNNRVPAIVDHHPLDGGDPLSVFESGAILFYLADRQGALCPSDPRRRIAVTEWVMWQMAGQGPMAGQAGHFRNYAPEAIPYAIERYANEITRLYRILNARLDGSEFVAGDYSIADIACWPWVLYRQHHGIDLADFPHVERWFERIAERPAVQRALNGYEAPPPHVFTDEQRASLFGKSAT